MIKRLNIIGDNWIYYKVYTGSKTADNFLINQIRPLVEHLLAQNVIKEWFFIRYNDPNSHLRIRYKCNTAQLPIVINMMYNILDPMVQNHTIWKVQNETYNREIERYGESTMELVESIFYHDSNMVINFLSCYNNDEEKRWLFALKAIDHHLDLFNYSLIQKRDLLKNPSTNFKSEFVNSKGLNSNLNDKFRENKKIIENFMEQKEDDSEIIEILKIKNNHLTDIADKIVEILKDDTSLPINNLNASLIHMMLNRIFRSKNRMNEFVCYEFLHRYYH